MQKIFITPVKISTKIPKYAQSQLHTKEALEHALQELGCNVMLQEQLKGGFVSQVYAGVYEDKQVVVKHTEDLIPFDPTDLFINKQGHTVDTLVLNLLNNTSIRVPHVIRHFPDITTTIMEDVRMSGYQLLSNEILSGTFHSNSATSVGNTLAQLAKEARKWKKFKTNESAMGSMYERGLDLRLAYPNTQKQYLALEKQFTEQSEYWMWPDGHPKNIFVNKDGEVACIDFGRSCWADQRYMLPNFLAHIVIYCLGGYIAKDMAREYIHVCTKAYRTYEAIDESLFCQYLAMEVLHRANGKWIQGIDTSEQKLRIYRFGLQVFDNEISSIDSLFPLLSVSLA